MNHTSPSGKSPAFKQRLPLLCAGMSAAFLALASNAIYAQTVTTLPTVDVQGQRPADDAGTNPAYRSNTFSSGPLGDQNVMDIPASVTTITEDLMANTQASTVNDALRYLPSVMIRNQQGYEVSRPQSRGFLGSVFQNTRLDGLSVIGTTAIAGEMLSGIQVLNGVGGSLYGAANPAGIFNYITKKPTDEPLRRFTLGYDSNSVWTESADLGGRAGPDGQIGYRLNAVHGAGESYVEGSKVNRNLFSAAFDIHLSPQTVIEANYSYYDTDITGLPGQINFVGKNDIQLPSAPDPTRQGYGQLGAGSDLRTNTSMLKVKHTFNDQWSLELGALYQDAFRGVYGITNVMQTADTYKITKNFSSWPHSTMFSNLVALNGKVEIGGFKNDLTFATNGFENNIYSYNNSIVQTDATVYNWNDPQLVSFGSTPATGGQYRQSRSLQQSLVAGDTIHLTDKVALQGILSSSDIDVTNYNKNGSTKNSTSDDGKSSWTLSAIYKPTTSLMTYATVSHSVEQGETAPTGTGAPANAGQYLGIYHDKLYEMGAKYSLTPDFLLSTAVFHMTRPLAGTDLTSNMYEILGTQTNNGIELFVQGNATNDLGVFGGITYIDARLNNTGSASTNDSMVVGVPQFKSDLVLDYHPASWNGFALTGAAHYESRRAAINTNTMWAPSYATFDAGVRYTTGVGRHLVTARLQVQNLTNKYYYSSLFDGGSNVGATGGYNVAYVAPPRTVMATVSFAY